MSSALRGTSYIENGTPGPMPGRWTVRVRKFHPANFLVIALLISMILNPHGMLSYFLLGLVVSTFFMGTGLGMYSAWRTLRAEARAHAAVTNALFGHTPRESLHSFRLQSGLLDQQFDNLNYDVLREFGYVNFSAARPLREEEINLLSVHRYKLTRTQSEGSYVEDADGTKECFEEELTCSICLEDAKIGEIIRTLPCYHEIKLKNVTRLCHTKSIVTVNGQFPGPKIVAREGDRVVVKVVNHVSNNITIHWHGIRQLRSGWADGPAYVTQCPIQTGQSYVYNFTITGQRGTLFWHAHISWLRSTLYGPIIILPKQNVPYPFAKPYKEVPIIFGEWFKADTEAIISQALQTGGGPNVSDAYTINGLPGPLYNCSKKDTFKLKVKPGKTYMLRLINAALNDELFFSIANHTLTIVDADAVYVKPFETDTLLITPGQTTNVLLKTKNVYPHASFVMAARPYVTGQGTFDNSTTTGILEYHHSSSNKLGNNKRKLRLFQPTLPPLNDTNTVTNFTKRFRSLASEQFPANVPKNIDRRFFFTVGLGTNPCPVNHTCQGPNGSMFSASVNNVSFALPTTALLQAHFFGKSFGVYSPNFPYYPLHPFNYTGTPPNNTNVVSNATNLMVLPFNTSVELVMQDTSILGAESHPLHLHGFNFFVVGQGFGNYDANKDPKSFNLIDPVERNTVGVPSGGWVAIRFLADNPGVWFMHCHLEIHTSWGLKMAWLVLNGDLPNQKLLPPPSDLPKC